MANRSATLSMRIEPSIKQSAENLYRSLGLSLTDAVNVFLYRSLAVGGFPFEVRQPRFNQETEEAMAEVRAMENGEIESKQYSSVEELFADLAADD